MRTLIMDSLADARFGLCLLVVAAALAGCAKDTPPVAVGGAPTSDREPGIGDYRPDPKLAFNEPVHFDTDSAQLRPSDKPVVQKVAALFAAYPQMRVIVEGHADERGTREYNLALGQRRAVAYRSALIAAGVPTTRIIDTISYGKERPVAVGSDEAAWAQNRRALAVVQ